MDLHNLLVVLLLVVFLLVVLLLVVQTKLFFSPRNIQIWRKAEEYKNCILQLQIFDMDLFPVLLQFLCCWLLGKLDC